MSKLFYLPLFLAKWLGENRVRPLVVDNSNSKEKIAMVKRWAAAQGQVVNPVLIVSYETLRAYTKYLKNSPIGLLLCDEGHRLKNGCEYILSSLFLSLSFFFINLFNPEVILTISII